MSSDVIGKQMEILLYDPLHRWSWNCESSTPLFVRFAGGCNHRISDAFFDGLIKQFLQTWRRWDTHQSSTCAPTWKSGVLIVLCRNSLIMVLCYKYHGVQKVNIFRVHCSLYTQQGKYLANVNTLLLTTISRARTRQKVIQDNYFGPSCKNYLVEISGYSCKRL